MATKKNTTAAINQGISALNALQAKTNPAPAAAVTPSQAQNTVNGNMATVEPDHKPLAVAAAKNVKGGKDDFEPIELSGGRFYFPRPINLPGLKGVSDVDFLRRCRAGGIQVLMEGPPGCGKTMLFEAAFSDGIIIEGNGDLEADAFIGRYVPEGNDINKLRWVDGPVVTALREGRPLLIDEATQINPMVMVRVYPALDSRRRITIQERGGEVVQAAEGYWACGAHNPDVVGMVMSEALGSRMTMRLPMESDLNLARRIGVPEGALMIAQGCKTLRNGGAGIISWAPEMRELVDFGRIAKIFGENIAAANLLAHCPEEERDEVGKLVNTAYPEVTEPLKISGDLGI